MKYYDSMSTSSIKPVERFLPKDKRRLPATFQPLGNSVIIGKSKQAKQAPGSRRLRVLIESQLKSYVSATHRREKGAIVSNMVYAIQEACPEGGAFVKFDGGDWWEVSETIARENISATFRNFLHDQYKSSSKRKNAKRRNRRLLGMERSTKIPQKKNQQEQQLEEQERVPAPCTSSNSNNSIKNKTLSSDVNCAINATKSFVPNQKSMVPNLTMSYNSSNHCELPSAVESFLTESFKVFDEEEYLKPVDPILFDVSNFDWDC